MRCPFCGFYNSRGARSCGRCHRELRPSGQTDLQLEAVDPPPATPPGYADEPGLQPLERPEARPMVTTRPVGELALRGLGALGLWRREPDLQGTVIAADAPYYEPPDFDGYRMLNRMLLILEFLGLPFLLLWALLKFAGPFSLILGLLGLYLFFKFLSHSNLFALLGIFHFLSPAKTREEQVPLQYFRVRDRSEREHMVRRKGHLRSGHLMPGDEVALWGHWRNGIFHLRSGLNLRTQAQIAVQPSYSWVFLLLNLGILSVFIALFYEPLRGVLERILRQL